MESVRNSIVIVPVLLLLLAASCGSAAEDAEAVEPDSTSAGSTTSVVDGVSASLIQGNEDADSETTAEGAAPDTSDSETSEAQTTTETTTTETTTNTSETTTTVPTRVIIRPGDAGSFTSPSGNIACVMSSGLGVSCWIGEKQWTIDGSTEGDCNFDFGNAIDVTAEGVAYPCYSDFYWEPNAEALAYGDEMQVADFRCVSARDGVSCFNGEGQGFRLSRAVVELF